MGQQSPLAPEALLSSGTSNMRITKSDASGWAATSILTHSPLMRSTEGCRISSDAAIRRLPQAKPTRHFNNYAPSRKGHL